MSSSLLHSIPSPRLRLLSVLPIALAMLTSASPLPLCVARADIEPQPSCQHSTLVGVDGIAIRDSEFADLLTRVLLKNGADSNVRNASLFFQQCFAGGILDDVKSTLADKVKWVGGAASKHLETSWGFDIPAGNSWTDALVTELAKKDQVLKQSIENANDQDSLGVNSVMPLEHGQSVTGGGGETVTLSDTNARAHHAILWAGAGNGRREFGDISKIRASLINAWGQGSTVSISVLFGDGIHQGDGITPLPASWAASAATRSNLLSTIFALTNALNTNEQFLFYSSDPGGWQLDLLKIAVPIPSGSVTGLNVTVPLEIAKSLVRQSGNTPGFNIAYQGGPAEVRFDGQSLATLSSGQTNQFVPITEYGLDGDHELAIQNLGTSALTLRTLTFDSGKLIAGSPPLTQPVLGGPIHSGANNLFTFTVRGEPGLDYCVQSSPDFHTWSSYPGGTFASADPLTFFTFAPPSVRYQFFRAGSTLKLIFGTAGNHGSINPPAVTYLSASDSILFTAMPENGYITDIWSINGVPVAFGDPTLSVTAGQTPQYVQVTFRSMNP